MNRYPPKPPPFTTHPLAYHAPERPMFRRRPRPVWFVVGVAIGIPALGAVLLYVIGIVMVFVRGIGQNSRVWTAASFNPAHGFR